MRLFGLIGYPLSHSFSKKFFADKFEKENLPHCYYENFPLVNIRELKNLLEEQRDLEGLNVTIPYKEQVLPLLDEKDEIVTRINACNCISIKNGRLKGYNTDVAGFEQSLKSQWKTDHRNALILGTGGASKAVEFVLQKLGIAYRYVSRNPTGDNYSYSQLSSAIISTHTLIINTTPVGTYPEIDESPPIPYEYLTSSHYLFDLVYNPAKTLFLQRGEEKGAAIQNGYDMLIIQALESWNIWNK